MSLQRFWTNVRSAVELSNLKVSGPPGYDTTPASRALRSLDPWFVPRSVSGFEPTEFDFLPAPERERLGTLVNRFLTVVQKADENNPATDARNEGKRLLGEIVTVLDIHRYADAEAFRLGKQIEQAVAGRLPQWVAELRFETGDDSTGDPAIYIWAVLRDEAADPDAGPDTDPVLERLFDVAREVAPGRWPYIRFRSVSEQAELAEAASP